MTRSMVRLRSPSTLSGIEASTLLSFAQGHSVLRLTQHGSKHGEWNRTKRLKGIEE